MYAIRSYYVLDGIQLDHANYLFATSSGLLNLNLETGDFTTFLGSDIEDCKSIQKINTKTLLVTLSSGVAVIEYEELDQRRITSYNVCYTKLLRTSVLSEKNGCQR